MDQAIPFRHILPSSRWLLALAFSLIFCLPFTSRASLVPGDIAFVGMNTDGSTDAFAFVALRNLNAGETIYFTDAGWKIPENEFYGSETWVGYTVPGSGLSAGTVVTLYMAGALSNSGDQLIAYQGSFSNPSPIAALNNSGGSWQGTAGDEHSSALPHGLSEGHTALALTHKDNVKFNGPYSGSHANLLSAIHDPNNWTGSNSYTQQFNTNCTVSSGSPLVTMGDFAQFSETDGTVQIVVSSDRTGGHTATVSVSGGDAQNGSDYNFGPQTVTFSNSRTAMVTLSLLDDTDCENLEHINLQLTGSAGVAVRANGMEISLKDNEAGAYTLYQGFESSPNDTWPFTYYPSTYNSQTGPDPQTVVGTQAIWDVVKSFSGTYYAPQGDLFWGMQDIDNVIGGGNYWHYVDFQPISLQDVEDAVLKFKYFTYNSTSQDQIEYSVMYDAGSNWSSYTQLPYNTAAWLEESIQIPNSASHVRLRIRAKESNGILCGGIDEVSLNGILCASNFTLTTLAVDSLLCAGGGALTVPFSSTGTFLQGNVFTAELSDATGSFANPTVIGSLSLSGQDPSGVIQGQIPASVPAGTGYRVRVVSSTPVLVAADNGTDISITEVGLQVSAFQYSNGHNVSCPGSLDGSIDLSVTSGQAPFTYAWTGPNGFTSSSEDLSGIGSGTYAVTVTDASGCVGSETITLTEPAFDLTLTATGISCYGQNDGSITAQASGGALPYTYTWSGGSGSISSSTAIYPSLSAGTYTITVTDGNGCSLSDSVTITEPDSLQLAVNSPSSPCGHHISCANGSDGSIDLAVTGGSSPFTYTWSGPGSFASAQEDLSGLSAGSYAVTVVDANGCSAVTGIVLSQPDIMDAGIDAIAYNCGFNISCNGASDGAAFAVGLIGGCPPYNYQWSNGDTDSIATGLSAGNHSLTVTDAGGCSIVRDVILTEPAAITTVPLANAASCNSAANGSIDMTTTGGCLPYTYAWTGPGGFTSNEEHPDSLLPGTYDYTITDPNGCNTSGSVVIQALNNISASLGCCQDTSICSGETVDLAVELTGTGPFEVLYTVNGDTALMLAPTGISYISLTPSQTVQVELISVESMFSGCVGDVCGTATIGVNECETPCEDLCVEAGVVSVVDNGSCRTVDLELACDSLCAANSASECPGTQVLTFNQDPNGNPIPAGTIVGNQWASMGVTFSFVNNNPNHAPLGVIFDSSNPTGGDDDLGTPHSDFGGPGIGAGGAQGAPGQNDTALGNLLVLAENDVDANNDGLIDDPDDEGAGGEMQMNFAYPYFVESMSIVDLDNGNGLIRVEQTGNRVTDFNIPGLGDNAVTTVAINLDSVERVRVILPGSGGISALAFCPTNPGFVDISVPCGNISSYSNSAGLPMQLISRDSATGITGIRILGLPSDCIDSTGQGPFTVTYTICGLDQSCGGDFCPPLLAIGRGGCIQYETAGMGSVIPAAPQGPGKENPIPEGLRGRIDLYPNPVQEGGTMQLFLREGGVIRVDVYNMAGMHMGMVHTGEVAVDEVEEKEFQVGNWPEGMYVLRMVTASGEVYSKRFILAK